MSGLKSGAASQAAREPSAGCGNDVREDGDLHGLRGRFGGVRGGLDVADAPGELDADSGRVVQLGLQHADAGGLLHGVEHHHGRRPAADLEDGERLNQKRPRFLISCTTL